MGKAVTVLTYLVTASAVGAALSSFHDVAISLVIVSAVLTAANQAVDFKERARFHRDYKANFSHWRNELTSHRKDYQWIRRTTKAMHNLWDENSTKYVVHYGVDALAWNDAFLQTRPADLVEPKDLFEVWTWEMLTMHILPFSRQYFITRQNLIRRWSARRRRATGALLITLAISIISVSFLFVSVRNTNGLTYAVMAGSTLVSLFLLDAGLHIVKAALLELGVSASSAHELGRS
jgi:hypothetical protein